MILCQENPTKTLSSEGCYTINLPQTCLTEAAQSTQDLVPE